MNNEPHAATHHVTPPRVYVVVYVLLLVLMVATVAAAQMRLGVMNNIVAMTIAVIKATLVVLFFMQVRYSSRLTWLWASIGFIWLLILFGIVVDYNFRDWPAAGW